jgi:hypothetical protein
MAYRRRRLTNLSSISEYPIQEELTSDNIIDGTVTGNKIKIGSISYKLLDEVIQKEIYDMALKYGLLTLPFNPLPSDGLTLTFTILPDNINGGIVRLNWTAPYLNVAGATFDKYLIFIKATTSLNYNSIPDASINFGVNTCTITGLTNGLSHSVEIKSYNSIYDVSSLGIEATGMIPRRFPYAPTGLTRLSIEDSKVNLLWNLLTGIQRGGSLIISYRIKYTIGAGQTEYFDNTENNTPSLLINNLTNGEYYYFNVAGVNFFGELGDYSQQLAYRPIGIPGLPGISNATPGDGLVNITLVAPTYTGGINVTLLGYHVYYKINGTSDIESNWTQSRHSLASVIFPNINVTISGLTNGTKYDFRIKALNEINSGSYVNVLNIRPRGTPSPSTVNSITPSNGAVNISWTAPADRGGVSLNELIYNIIYSTTNTTVPSGTTISPGIITTTSANFTITGLTNGTRYYFWINTSNGLYFSNSSVSNSKPRTTPGVVSSLNTSGSNTPTIVLSWSSPTNTGGADITGYNIYVNGSFRANISGTGYSITSLPAGSNTFRVHAVNEAGEGTLSNISAYVVNVPETVSSLSTSGSNTPTITLVWSPPSYSGADITRYDIYVNDIYRTNTSSNTIPISSLQSGSNKFGIRAINAVGFQGTIREIFANVVNLPGAVNSLRYTGNNTPTIILFWSIPTNTGGSSITGYNIYVNGSFRANITGTTYSITSLPAGSNTFRVHAVNVAGEGTISSITANVVNVPPMPQDFIASVNSPVTIGNIAFNWGPVTNPTTNTDYMIQSRNVSYNWGYSDFQSIDNSVFTSRSYVVQYPSDYRTLQYSFRIRRTTEGLESYSNESSVTLPNPGFQGTVRIGPNVPSGLYDYYISTPQGVELAEAQINRSVGEFTINNSPAGLSQLVIRIKRRGTYFGHDPNPHSLGPRISSNVIFDSPLSGYNYINNIDWSTLANNEISFAPRIYSEHLFNSVVSLSFETITLPNAPTNLRNSIESTSSIKISWDLPIGTVSNIILSYRLNIYGTHFSFNNPESWNTSTLEDGWIEVTLSGNTTTHTVYNLEAGRWYTFRTRSAITIGGISYPGKWSSSNIFPHFANTEFSNWTNAAIPTSAPAPWTSSAWQAAITCSVINDFSNGTLDSQLNLTPGRSGVSTPNFPSVSSNRHWLINFSYPADIVSDHNSLLLDQQKAFRIRRGALFLINDLPSSYEIYVTDRTSSYSLTQLILSMGNLSYNPNNYNRTIRAFDQLAQNNFQTGPVSWVISTPGNVNLPNIVQFLEIRPKNILGETATNVSSPQRSLLPKVHLPPTIFRVEISYDYLTSATIIKYVFSINQTMLNPASPITKIKMDFIRTASNFVRSINYSFVQNQYDTFTANYSSNTVSVSPGTSNWNVFERTNDWTPFITSSLGTIGESGPWNLNSAPNGNHAGRGGANYKWQSDSGPLRNAQDTHVYNIVTQNTELRGFLTSCMINRTNADVFDPAVAWPQMLMKMFRIRFTVTSDSFPQFNSQGDSYYPTSVIIRPGYILPGFPSTSTTFVR